MKQINIVIPMAGAGSRFAKEGYTKPKPFIPVRGTGYTTQDNERQNTTTQDKTMQDKTMIECVLQNLTTPNAKFTLIALKAHLEGFKELVEGIRAEFKASFIPIKALTQGTACTILQAQHIIDNDTPLLIANSDQIVDLNIKDFIDDCFLRKLDGSILCFEEPSKDTKWSFVRTDEKHLVCEVREKEAISTLASVGIYLFARGSDFINAANAMIAANERVNNEFYTAPVYNHCIKRGLKIGIYLIKKSQMHGLGTPQDLAEYERFLKNACRFERND